MENCVAPGLDKFDILLETVLSLVRVYKSERWASCRNQTPSWYDWKIVERDVKPEQTTTTT